MSDDRNEALRLAEYARGDEYQRATEAAIDLINELDERIAELESRVHTCGPTCSKAGCINRRLTDERDQLRIDLDDELCNREVLDTMLTQCIAERDQLRAEVERLKPNAERWEYALNSEEFAVCEWGTVFGELCWVPISEESAIDHARTTHKDEG